MHSRWCSLACGQKLVLSLGVDSPTVIFAGWVFDSMDGFNLLCIRLGSAAIATAVAGALVPGRRRPVPVPAEAD